MERLEIKKVYIRNIENKEWKWKNNEEKNKEQQKYEKIIKEIIEGEEQANKIRRKKYSN